MQVTITQRFLATACISAAVLLGLGCCTDVSASDKACKDIGTDDYDLTISIRVPGRYCLAKDMHTRHEVVDRRAQGRLIQIWASNVELDLRGHVLGRGRFFVQPGGTGIEILGFLKNIRIANGFLRDFDVAIERLPEPFLLGYPEGAVQMTAPNSWTFAKDNIVIDNVKIERSKIPVRIYDEKI